MFNQDRKIREVTRFIHAAERTFWTHIKDQESEESYAEDIAKLMDIKHRRGMPAVNKRIERKLENLSGNLKEYIAKENERYETTVCFFAHDSETASRKMNEARDASPYNELDGVFDDLALEDMDMISKWQEQDTEMYINDLKESATKIASMRRCLNEIDLFRQRFGIPVKRSEKATHNVPAAIYS